MKNVEGSVGEARGKLGGKLGEAGGSTLFWGEASFLPLKFLEESGEAIGPSTLFIILKVGKVGPRRG